MEKKYIDALKELNQEYKKLYYSKEYRLGKQMMKFKYYFKTFKFKLLFTKIFKFKNKNKVFKIDNSSNETIFKDNSDYYIKPFKKFPKTAVYSVNIGGYDKLIQPLIDADNVDFYIVSDKKPNKLGKWKWLDANKYLKGMNLSNVKKARYIKTHPHLIFNDYDYSIFIDGNIRCILNISEFVNNINSKTGIAIHPHPYRDCVYKELIALDISGKGNYPQMKKQVNGYKKEGMPDKFGLFETNVLVRNHNNYLCKKLMEDWWTEIELKSERDQLSFTYVLWKNKLISNDIGIIWDSIKNNPYVQVIDHLEEYEK